MEKWRLICKLIYIINIMLEIAGVGATYLTFDSHCVLGGEISLWVMIFLLLMPFAVIVDLVFVALMFLFRTLGTDPMAIMYNIFSGVTCLVAGIPAIMMIASLCGNSTQIFFVSGGILAEVSGVFHIINAVIINMKMPRSERYWPKKKGGKEKFKNTIGASGSDVESGGSSSKSEKSNKSAKSDNSSKKTSESSKSSVSNKSSESNITVENGGKIKKK